MNLYGMSERLLGVSIEGLAGSEVVLYAPNGSVQTVKGQVVNEYSSVGEDSRGIVQGSRQVMKIKRSSVTLRTSSLSPLPSSEENWVVCVPVHPGVEGTEIQKMFLEEAVEGSNTMGYMILRLTSALQVTP